MGLSVWWISVLLIQLHEHPCITNTLYVALIEYTGYNRKDCNGLQIERNIKRMSKEKKREFKKKKSNDGCCTLHILHDESLLLYVYAQLKTILLCTNIPFVQCFYL